MKFRSLLIICAIAMATLLIGCKEESPAPQGSVDNDTKSLTEMGKEMADEAEDAAEDAMEATKDAAEEAAEETKDAAAAMEKKLEE